MKWRFCSPPGHGGAPILWARSERFRLYRILPDGFGCGGVWVPGLTRIKPILTVPHRVDRRVRRTYRTVYGARMAAEAAERERRAS